MKHLRHGVTMELDDALVMAHIEAAGIVADWREAEQKSEAGSVDVIMLYDNPEAGEAGERWIIARATLPGDSGLVLVRVPVAVLTHPDTQTMWLNFAHTFRVEKIEGWTEVFPKRKDRH